MSDDPSLRKLFAILRLGDSPIPAEADAALRKGIELMDSRGISIEAIIERVDTKSFPQAVCADLARRYCLSREGKTNSEREEYYRRIFLSIARRYSPEEKKSENPRTSDKPNDRRSGGGENDRARTEGTQKREDDFLRRMDELRRKEEEFRRRERSQTEAERSRRPPEPEKPYRRPTRRLPTIRNEFLSVAFCHPVKTVRLFLSCLIGALIPGIVIAVIGGWLCDRYDIRLLDSFDWTTILGAAMFPFMVRRGYALYRGGWYHR